MLNTHLALSGSILLAESLGSTEGREEGMNCRVCRVAKMFG